MTDLEPTKIGLWIVAGVLAAICLWTFVATIVTLIRRKSKIWHFDVIFAVLFCGGTGVAAWLLSQMARAATG
jgi:hypothetical protein